MKLVIRALFAVAAAAATLTAATVQAKELRAERSQEVERTVVDQAKRFTAWQVAQMLDDQNFAPVLEKHLGNGAKSAMLKPVLADYAGAGKSAKATSDTLGSVDKLVREHKAIAGESEALMELRLYVPKGYMGPVNWQNTLVAYTPAGKRKQWTTVEAFDHNGQAYQLDARTPPSSPVLIAGLNKREDLRAGVAMMNRELVAAGLQAPRSMAKAGYVDTAKLDRVRLRNDEEPWISGSAEIYAIVSGVQPDQAKAELSIVDLPYLDHDGTTYNPNQILVFWSQYRYAAANVQFFEHDDNTNYKDLVVALSQGVTAILGAFAPTYAVIGQVATAILQAMPAHWFSNDDDYVDSFYTLEKSRTYTDYAGVGGNAVITLTPYRLLEQ